MRVPYLRFLSFVLPLFFLLSCGQSTHYTSTPSDTGGYPLEETPSTGLGDTPLKPISIEAPDFNCSAFVVVNTDTTQALYSPSIGSLSMVDLESDTEPSQGHCAYDLKDRPIIQTSSLSRSRVSASEFGDSRSFDVYDYETKRARPIQTRLVYDVPDSQVMIYIQSDAPNRLEVHDMVGGIREVDVNWSEIGTRLNTSILPRIRSILGPHFDYDGNRKLMIVVVDFDFNPSLKTAKTLGYFWAGDLMNAAGSNHADVIFINSAVITNETGAVATSIEETSFLRTIAHEYTHLVVYSQRKIFNELPSFSAWMNEGLAESVASYGLNALDTLNMETVRRSEEIAAGQSFFAFRGYGYQYAMANLFLEYARLQSGFDGHFYGALVRSYLSDSDAITALLAQANPAFSDFKTVVLNFHLALVIQNPSGVYGFSSESSRFNLGRLSYLNRLPRVLSAGGRGVIYSHSASSISNFTAEGLYSGALKAVKINAE